MLNIQVKARYIMVGVVQNHIIAMVVLKSLLVVDMVEIWVEVMVGTEDMKDMVTMAGMAGLQEVMV